MPITIAKRNLNIKETVVSFEKGFQAVIKQEGKIQDIQNIASSNRKRQLPAYIEQVLYDASGANGSHRGVELGRTKRYGKQEGIEHVRRVICSLKIGVR